MKIITVVTSSGEHLVLDKDRVDKFLAKETNEIRAYPYKKTPENPYQYYVVITHSDIVPGSIEDWSDRLEIEKMLKLLKAFRNGASGRLREEDLASKLVHYGFRVRDIPGPTTGKF